MRFAEHAERSPPAERLTSPIWSTSPDPFRSRTTDAQHGRARVIRLATGLGRHPAGRRTIASREPRTSRRRTPTAAVGGMSRVGAGRRSAGAADRRSYSPLGRHAHRRPDLPDRPVDPPGPPGRRAGGPGLRVAVGHRAHPHPDQPPHAVAGRPGAARGVPPHARPVRRPDGGGDGDRAAASSAPASRSSPSTTRSSWPRRSPRSTSCRAGACCSASASAGTRTRWSTTASTRSGGAPSPARRSWRCARCGPRRRRRSTASSCSFSPSWSWPKPVSRPAPADPHGRRRRAGDVPPRRRVLRRLDADPRPPQHRRQARRAAPGRRRGRAGHGDDRARRVRLPGRPRGHRRLRRAGLHPLRARRAPDRRGRRRCAPSTAPPTSSRTLRPRLSRAGPRRRPGLGRGARRQAGQRDRARRRRRRPAGSSTPAGPAASTRSAAWMATLGRRRHVAMVDAPLVVANATGMRPCEREIGRRYGRWKVSANALQPRPARRSPASRWPARLAADGWRCADGRGGPPAAGRWLYESFPYTTLVGAAGARLRPRAPGLQAQAAPPHADRVPGAAGRQLRRARPAGRRPASPTRRSTCARTR